VAETHAIYPVVPMVRSLAVTVAVLGAAGLGVVLLLGTTGGEVLGDVVGCALVALLWGLLMWVVTRGRALRQLDGLPEASGPPRGTERGAVRRGALNAVAMAVAMGAVAAAFALVGAADAPSAVIPGIAIGAGLWQALQARDLRRWEHRSGRRVHTRAGARRFAWTRAQAREQLVLAQ
jgi:hypothetical protein